MYVRRPTKLNAFRNAVKTEPPTPPAKQRQLKKSRRVTGL